MRTVELVAQRSMQLREQPLPEDPRDGEVIVKLRAIGICGSDLHWFEDGGIGPTKAVFPLILGHEPVGEVVAVGAGVTTHKEGDRVAIEPSIVCGQCEFCRMGRPNNCVSCVFMGGNQAPGFFREYATVPARNAEHVPNSMDFVTATMIEPLAVVVHVFELVKVRPGDTVAVLGAGPIGLLTAQMAKLAGASQVFLADRVPHRLRISRQIDPSYICINARETSAVDAVMDSTGGRGVDVVLDAAGAPETIDTGIQIARPSGQFMLIGIPTVKQLTIDIHTAMMKELSLLTLKRSNHKGHEAIHLLESGRISDVMITHRMGLEHTPEAFEMLSEYRDGVGKMVIEIE